MRLRLGKLDATPLDRVREGVLRGGAIGEALRALYNFPQPWSCAGAEPLGISCMVPTGTVREDERDPAQFWDQRSRKHWGMLG